MTSIYLISVTLVVLTNLVHGVEKWPDLRLHWGMNYFSGNNFVHQPRQISEIDARKYTRMENFCNADGSCKGPFCGIRYQLSNDPAVRLLYDPTNGYIIGIQTSVLKSKWSPAEKARIFAVDDDDYWTLTAYFVDPANACKTRSYSSWFLNGTGDGLWIQRNNFATAMKIPDTEAEMKKPHEGDWWTLGKCFKTMGVHYWFNIARDMDCEDYYPVFVMYNDGKLDAFGWAIPTGQKTLVSPKYEHPSASQTWLFMKDPPTCLSTNPDFASLNTMHIFFNNNWHWC